MNIETMTQTEVKEPPYGKIAEAILTIGADAKVQGQDQETIRTMLHAFTQATQPAYGISELGLSPKRY